MWYESGSKALSRSQMPSGVRWLLLVTVISFILQHLIDFRTNGTVTRTLGLSRDGFLGHAHLWQIVTYIFLHGGYDGPSRFLLLPFLHIFMNMFVLVMFGREVENYLGTERFLYFYIGCGVVAGLGWLMISGAGSSLMGGLGPPVCIGASGAVCGTVAAFSALYPKREVMLIFLPIRMTMRTMILIMGGITIVLIFFDTGNVAHAAHLAGGLAGYFYGRRAKPNLRVMSTPETPNWQSSQWTDVEEEHGLLKTEEAPEPPDKQEIDAILEKIQANGIGSLSRQERRTLEEAGRQAGDR